jgi:hypothetical protein
VDNDEESQETSYKQYVIDVSAERYQACESFSKYPHTRLGKLVNSSTIEVILSLCEEFAPGNPPEFVFDQNPKNFAAVLEILTFLIVEKVRRLFISYLVNICSICYCDEGLK